MATKFPYVEVALVGSDGNAFAILGTVQRAMRAAGVAETEVSQFFSDATSGDYDHLLQTVMATVAVS